MYFHTQMRHDTACVFVNKSEMKSTEDPLNEDDPSKSQPFHMLLHRIDFKCLLLTLAQPNKISDRNINSTDSIYRDAKSTHILYLEVQILV